MPLVIDGLTVIALELPDGKCISDIMIYFLIAQIHEKKYDFDVPLNMCVSIHPIVFSPGATSCLNSENS